VINSKQLYSLILIFYEMSLGKEGIWIFFLSTPNIYRQTSYNYLYFSLYAYLRFFTLFISVKCENVYLKIDLKVEDRTEFVD